MPATAPIGAVPIIQPALGSSLEGVSAVTPRQARKAAKADSPDRASRSPATASSVTDQEIKPAAKADNRVVMTLVCQRRHSIGTSPILDLPPSSI